MPQVTKTEILEQLLSDICHVSHKHQDQYWLDAPGTDEEKLQNINALAREALYIFRNGSDDDIHDYLARYGPIERR